MKNIILTISLFFFIRLYSQSGEIIYKAIPIENVSYKNKPLMSAVNKEMTLMEFKLSFDSENSHFTKEKNLPVNKAMQKMAEIFITADIDSYQTNNKKKSFKNIEISDTIYRVDYSKRMRDWELTNEVKFIDGYQCFKAIRIEDIERTNGKREYTAWYTTDIPLPYGPAGQGGLPGLILQLQIGNIATYIVDKILLNPKKKVTVKKIKSGKLLTINEMVNLKRDKRKYVPENKN